MKRFLTFMVVNVALFAPQIGSAQSAEFNPEILIAKGRIAYSNLAKACIFRVGAVGYSGRVVAEKIKEARYSFIPFVLKAREHVDSAGSALRAE